MTKLTLPPADWIKIEEPASSEKSSEDKEIESLVRSLCRGDFSDLEKLSRIVPKPKMSVFVSSTFTDTQKGDVSTTLSSSV